MIDFDFSTLPGSEVYKLLSGTIIPRPIALVSTQGLGGRNNLAPFSFFNAVSSNPPCISISITQKRRGGKKDTWLNIEETGQFVVNLVTAPMAEAINQASAEYPYGVDEMHEVGLTPLASTRVKPPRVKESPIQMECAFFKSMTIGESSIGSTILIIGKVLVLHLDPKIYRDGQIDPQLLDPLARLGGSLYGRSLEIFSLPRAELSPTKKN